VRYEPVCNMDVSGRALWTVWMQQCHRGGRCGSAQGATYAYSDMFMALVLVKAGVLVPSLPEHHSRQNPSGGAAVQTVGDGPVGGKE
jgi:hypothetical protein